MIVLDIQSFACFQRPRELASMQIYGITLYGVRVNRV